MLPSEAESTEFMRLLTSHQRDLHLYVHSLVLNPEAVEEIVQNTNLVLWEKRSQFDRDLEFRPWAFQIARYKVSEYRVQHKRKGICFSDSLIDELALQAPQFADVESELSVKLIGCLAQLTARDREILDQRYAMLTSCETIADTLGRPVRWVYNALNRIRRELFECVTRDSNTWRAR
jgi:RNA polymerase sigma-70 factor (ECF subfamily)